MISYCVRFEQNVIIRPTRRTREDIERAEAMNKVQLLNDEHF